jgi:RHS repeat-associated protein
VSELHCRWTTNQYTDCCKLASTRVYYAIPSSGVGAAGVNYNETDFGYDFLNRRNRVVSPGGTITRTVFDARDLPISVWVGTNDTGATWSDPTGGGATGNNMVLVTEYQYDNNLASLDGNRTAEIQHVDALTSRETNFLFDWRDRQVEVIAAQDWFQVVTLDNLDRTTQVDQYAQATNNLIRRSKTLYDDRSRVFQTVRFAVDPSTGTVGNSLTDNTWFDPSSNAIKQLPSGSNAFTKIVIDGAGRQTVQYFGFSPASSSSSSPFSSVGNGLRAVPWTGEGGVGSGLPNDPTADIIVEQTETLFDAASNAIQTTFRQRFHNATGTGPLTYPGGAQPAARVTYVAMYPDPIGRQQAQANYGTNGDATLSRPSTIPARADTVLVTATVENPRGEAYQSIDPAGRLDQTTFDDAGRRIELVLNVQPSSSSSSSSSSTGLPTSDDQNNTTLWSYTADSQIASLTAVNVATGNQTTMYLYGTSLPSSDVARNDVLASVVYPDGGIVTYLVNRQSQVKQFTDQRLVIHAYSFDLLGRQTQDAVISLGSSSSSSTSSSSSSSGSGNTSGVDGTVQRIGRTYEVRGLLQNITSYTSPIVGQGVVVNDVERVYNSFEQLVTEYQEHSGAVNTSTSVYVQYQYADGSSNTIRPTALIYPNGRVLTYSYGTSGSVDDALSRIASLIDNDGVTHLANYTRVGRGMFVEQSSPEPQIAWSLINGTGIDPYTGLDQFNRVVDNRWYNTATSADLDRIQHGYDRASNRLWRENTVAEAAGVYLDEVYANDGLYRLSEMQRGQLNGANTAIVSGTLNFAQAWGLDATGNWQQFWENESGSSWDLQQSRTASASNEITAIDGGGSASPGYDAAGNVLFWPDVAVPSSAASASFDAWNRMMLAYVAGAVAEQNVYDGMNRRVTCLTSSVLRHYYYSSQWHDLEERLGASSAAERQFVWHLRYADGLILRDRSAERLYALQDPNWNVSSLVDVGGTVQERYAYSPYGGVLYFDGSFAGRSSSNYDWERLFAGYYLSAPSGLHLARNRLFHSGLGCWLSVDPIGYNSGDVNLYRYALSGPLTRTDPRGTQAAKPGCPTWGDIYAHFKQVGNAPADADCVEVLMSDFLAFIAGKCSLNSEHRHQLARGCVGLATIYQNCNAHCSKADRKVNPEERATRCFQSRREAEDYPCPPGQSRFIFAMDGFWKVPRSQVPAGGFTCTKYMDRRPAAGGGVAVNYVSLFTRAGLCVLIDHGRYVTVVEGFSQLIPEPDAPEDPKHRQHLTICKSSAPECGDREGNDDEGRIWAVTCKNCSGKGSW